MYGAVSAASRRLGVRHAPFSDGSNGVAGAVCGTAFASSFQASMSGYHFGPVSRIQICALYAPHGRQFLPSPVQSQDELAVHSRSVGTAGPDCGTPPLWNASSVSIGPLWQSMQAAFPTNSRAPCFARSEIYVDRGPSATKRSKSLTRLTSVPS